MEEQYEWVLWMVKRSTLPRTTRLWALIRSILSSPLPFFIFSALTSSPLVSPPASPSRFSLSLSRRVDSTRRSYLKLSAAPALPKVLQHLSFKYLLKHLPHIYYPFTHLFIFLRIHSQARAQGCSRQTPCLQPSKRSECLFLPLPRTVPPTPLETSPNTRSVVSFDSFLCIPLLPPLPLTLLLLPLSL